MKGPLIFCSFLFSDSFIATVAAITFDSYRLKSKSLSNHSGFCFIFAHDWTEKCVKVGGCIGFKSICSTYEASRIFLAKFSLWQVAGGPFLWYSTISWAQWLNCPLFKVLCRINQSDAWNPPHERLRLRFRTTPLWVTSKRIVQVAGRF